MDKMQILLSTGMTEIDAKQHIKNGVNIYEVKDYLDNIDNYAIDLSEEDRNELKTLLNISEDGQNVIYNNDITTYNGIRYYIEYVL